jgi:hypothetical protein
MATVADWTASLKVAEIAEVVPTPVALAAGDRLATVGGVVSAVPVALNRGSTQ